MSGKRSKRERKAKKQSGEVTQRVYTLTEEQIDRIKEDATKEAMDRAFILMMGLPCKALRDVFGFGKTRLERFGDKVVDLYDSFEKGYISLDDCIETVKEETGVDFITVAKERRLV